MDQIILWDRLQNMYIALGYNVCEKAFWDFDPEAN